LDEEVIPTFVHALHEVCRHYGYQLIAYFLRPKQVNLLLGYKPSMPLTEIVGNIKRSTSHRLFEAIPHLERRIGRRIFWADGYYVETVSYHQVENLAQYWRRKEKQHKALLAAKVEAINPFEIDERALDRAMEELLPAERALIKLLHGLHGERMHSYEEVADMLSLKVEEVRQIEQEVLQKLRSALTGVRLTPQEVQESDE
jgi:REP element-mobilizing transposase RayT